MNHRGFAADLLPICNNLNTMKERISPPSPSRGLLIAYCKNDKSGIWFPSPCEDYLWFTLDVLEWMYSFRPLAGQGLFQPWLSQPNIHAGSQAGFRGKSQSALSWRYYGSSKSPLSLILSGSAQSARCTHLIPWWVEQMFWSVNLYSWWGCKN